jgi:hypothetical protein
MTEPGHPAAPAATPPPYAPGIPTADPAAGPAPSKAKKWLGVAGTVVFGGVAAASWYGLGATPEVGDCVTADGADSFEVVDCGSGEAQHRVVGIEEEEMSYDAYMADETLCAEHETTMMVLWVGEDGSDGTVLCAEPV